MRGQVLSLAVVLAAIIVIPVGLRGVNAALPTADVTDSFVPSFEPPRVREPFDEQTAATLRQIRPQYVVIGDSMGGVRINPGYLSRLTHRGVVALFLAGSPVSYWYLELKNFVVENDLHDVRGAMFFFRDDQLTRQVEVSSLQLDRVARDYEPDLDRVIARRRLGPLADVHRAARALYEFDRTRQWLEPSLLHLPARATAPPGQDAEAFVGQINSEVFPLARLRHFEASDLAAASERVSFEAQVQDSLLPELLSLAARGGIRLGFLCVQRRPGPQGPPARSPALVEYLAQLRSYLERHGAYFYDEWGDADQPLAVYADGDHLRPDQKDPYTERFSRRHAAFFQ